jgi:hypothetical protein
MTHTIGETKLTRRDSFACAGVRRQVMTAGAGTRSNWSMQGDDPSGGARA